MAAERTAIPHPDPDPLAQAGRARIVAWLSLPRGDRAELLNGRIVYKAMAGIDHGAAAGNIFAQLDRLQGPPGDGGGGWWLSQDVDLLLSAQGLRPDVVGWRTERHPTPPQKVNVDKHMGVIVVPPDWVCEVLSRSTRSRDEDEGAKWQAYLEAGVGHYWLVDLDHEQIKVYQRFDQGYELIEVVARTADKELPPFSGVRFVAARVFVLARALRSAQRDAG